MSGANSRSTASGRCSSLMMPLAHAELLLIDPVLPDWLPDLVVRGRRVGRATVDVRAWRNDAGRTEFDVLHKQGTLRVIRQPPLESLRDGIPQRLGALVETLAHH